MGLKKHEEIAHRKNEIPDSDVIESVKRKNEDDDDLKTCPICDLTFPSDIIVDHAEKCSDALQDHDSSGQGFVFSDQLSHDVMSGANNDVTQDQAGVAVNESQSGASGSAGPTASTSKPEFSPANDQTTELYHCYKCPEICLTFNTLLVHIAKEHFGEKIKQRYESMEVQYSGDLNMGHSC